LAKCRAMRRPIPRELPVTRTRFELMAGVYITSLALRLAMDAAWAFTTT